MKKSRLVIALVVVFVSVLYFIEFSKVNKLGRTSSKLSLDNLHPDEFSKNWELFYKVRATIIDGQSASFSIPQELKNKEGEELKLLGAAVFFGNGCEMIDDNTTRIKSFYLLPTLSLANSCVLNPAEAMRWTIMVHLDTAWVLSRNDMANTEAIVTGEFRIDTSKPYEAAFYVVNATAKLK
jgi:hypothetical protein